MESDSTLEDSLRGDSNDQFLGHDTSPGNRNQRNSTRNNGRNRTGIGSSSRELREINHGRYERMDVEFGGGRPGGDNAVEHFERLLRHKSVAGAVGGFGLFLLICLFSIGSLMPTEYGASYNMITKSLDKSNVYHGGRHWIWPWNSFIIFPATAPTIEFSENPGAQQGPLTTRTKDGLGISISVSFQYRLIQKDVTKLYGLANYNYEPLFIRNARDVLLKAAADYDAPEYWEKRAVIGEEMREFLEKRLRESYAECVGLQILVVHLPASYEKSIVETQVEKQRVETRQKEQESTKIEAQTKVIESEYDRNCTVILAQGKASYFEKTQLAQAKALKDRITVESEALAAAKRSLEIENATELVGYMKYLVLAQQMQNSFPPAPPAPPSLRPDSNPDMSDGSYGAIAPVLSSDGSYGSVSPPSGGMQRMAVDPDGTPNSVYIYNLENARVNVR